MLKFTRLKNKKTSRLKSSNIEWKQDLATKERVLHLVKSLNLHWIKTSNIHCFQSRNSKTRARARIWGLPKLWQISLNVAPSYIIEIITEKFDKLSEKNKDRVIIHELAHIPKNFSGSLLPHIRKAGKRNFNDKVRNMVKEYEKLKK